MKAREWVRSNGKVMFMGGLLLATPPYRCTGTEGGGGSGGSASAGTSSSAGSAASGTGNSGGAEVSAGSGGTAGTGTAGTEIGGSEAGGSTAGTETGGTTAGTETGGTTAGTETGGTTAGTEAGGTAVGGSMAGSGGASGGTVHGTGYDASVPGLVKDNQTGIVWQQLDDGSYSVLDWDNADNYCRELEHAGFDDWRMPSGYELFTLVQLESGASNHYDLTLFPNSPADYYWTSTPVTMFGAGWHNIVWFGSYQYGSWDGYPPQSLAADPDYFEHPVRCVRGGEVPPPRFIEYGDGTALDNLTGLVWEEPLTFDLSLVDAQERCNNLGGGWRLPAMVELLSALSSLEAPLENASWTGVPLWSSSAYVEAPPSQPGVYVLYESPDLLPQAYYGENVPEVAKSRCVR